MIIDKNNFWNWAHSAFLANTQRGILAEYIVGNALQCLGDSRTEWDVYDLKLENGKTIEVKSSAYIQNWEQTKDSTIRFGIAEKKNSKKRVADIYVFAVFSVKKENEELANPLNVDQWFFMVLATSDLDNYFGKGLTVGIGALEKLGLKRLKYCELADEVRAVCKLNRH
jgi:hypothetical protein